MTPGSNPGSVWLVSVSDLGVAERVATFGRMAGLPSSASWLRDPVTDAEVEFVEAALGHRLPADLVELLGVHNGGRLLNQEEWLPCTEHPQAGMLAYRRLLDDVVAELSTAGVMEHAASIHRPVQVTAASQVGILYDLDEVPGRLLYLEVTSDPPIVPLASSLVTLLDAYIAIAEAGLVHVDASLGPSIHGPPDEVRRIFVEHNVADVVSSGLSSWLAAPEAATFSID